MSRAHRIEITMTVEDARSALLLARLDALALPERVRNVTIVDVYLIDKEFSFDHLNRIGSMLCNPVSHRFSIDVPAVTGGFDIAIEIGFLPGVTDNVAATTRDEIEDLLGLRFAVSEGVYSSRLMLIGGLRDPASAQLVVDGLSNRLIQRANVKTLGQFTTDGGMGMSVPRVLDQKSAGVSTVDLDVSDDELMVIGRDGIGDGGGRRGPLSLDLLSMKAIQRYFRDAGRQPTDVELESIAQTWSEHCKHTIFADPIDEIEGGLYRSYIKRATEQIRANKGDRDFCVSVFTDNAGAVVFDDDFLITHKVETHNSPSALDPFGGAITGIVGVNRDAIGFGLGAKPVANVYGFCFGDPNDDETLYRDPGLTTPMLSPKRILEGVVEGVNHGGNTSGIPTPQGFVYFDDCYRGKPLVFVGTVGFLPRRLNGVDATEKAARPGDYIVMAGGRVGKDGIHGATFSSEAITSGSPVTAVQIGDPITQKKLSDAIVKEARQLNLYSSITDNGAGGLSCSVAEMARECGGCRVELEKVPLKYPGLAPWEIWISESQERMTLAVPPDKWDAFADLMRRRGVEATRIGVFTRDPMCLVTFNGEAVQQLEMNFLHNGLPQKPMTTRRPERKRTSSVRTRVEDLSGALLEMVGRKNLASFAFISSQFDHDVQGGSALKPLQGRGRVNGLASAFRPRLDSPAGAIVSQALFPSYTGVDPYQMAAHAIDAAIRNVVAAGADVDRIALLDNFCWCDSTNPERLWELKEAARACYDIAVAFSAPFISGKDSMFNDFRGFDASGYPVSISIQPTLLISSLGLVEDVAKTVSLEFKRAGDLIVLLGETRDALAGSEYLAMRGESSDGEQLAVVDAFANRSVYTAINRLTTARLLASAQSVGRGGLGIALALSAIGGMRGASVELPNELGGEAALFSESAGRVLVSVRPDDVVRFREIVSSIPHSFIGETNAGGQLEIGKSGGTLTCISVEELYSRYHRTFAGY